MDCHWWEMVLGKILVLCQYTEYRVLLYSTYTSVWKSLWYMNLYSKLFTQFNLYSAHGATVPPIHKTVYLLHKESCGRFWTYMYYSYLGIYSVNIFISKISWENLLLICHSSCLECFPKHLIWPWIVENICILN